jgi:hypothetical protein
VYCQTVQAEQDAGLSATPESHQRQLAALQGAVARCQEAVARFPQAAAQGACVPNCWCCWASFYPWHPCKVALNWAGTPCTCTASML